MRYQLYGVIHVYVVPGNEERKHPEVLFPQLFKSCLAVVSQITSIYALFKKGPKKRSQLGVISGNHI